MSCVGPLLTTGVVDIASKFTTGVYQTHRRSMVISENYQRPRGSWFKKETKSKISWHCSFKPVVLKSVLMYSKTSSYCGLWTCLLKPNWWTYNFFEVSAHNLWVLILEVSKAVSNHFYSRGGGGVKSASRGDCDLQGEKLLAKEEDFCPNYVQEFGRWSADH